jgi:hypothetical protein
LRAQIAATGCNPLEAEEQELSGASDKDPEEPVVKDWGQATETDSG